LRYGEERFSREWNRFMHLVAKPRCFVAAREGSSADARMAIIAITTSNSISVKPGERLARISAL